MDNPQEKREDKRGIIYGDLQRRQLKQEIEQNAYSAQIILSLLFSQFQPKSVLDVGCGLGTWLLKAKEKGATIIRGIEGDWIDESLLSIDKGLITQLDLEKPFDLKEKFDLVICLEVAEHLFSQSADIFIESLTKHGDALLFSAAIPFQGGHHHVNEQWPSYWQEKLAKKGFVLIDFIRPMIWKIKGILWWLSQNTLFYAREGLLETNEALKSLYSDFKNRSPLDIIHPVVYVSRIKSLMKPPQ